MAKGVKSLSQCPLCGAKRKAKPKKLPDKGSPGNASYPPKKRANQDRLWGCSN